MEGTPKLAAMGARCIVFALLALCSSGLALAQSKITVAQPVKTAAGAPASGYALIRATVPFGAPDGSWVDQVWMKAQLVNGQLSIALWPGLYTVEWHLDSGKARTDSWAVPAGTSPVTVATVTQAGSSGGGAGTTTASVNKPWINALDYGATHNGVRCLDGAMTSGSGALNSACANWSSADAGKAICADGEGCGTITSVTDGHDAVVSFPAGSTASGIEFVYGTLNDTAMAAAGAAAEAVGGVLYAPAGIYLLSQPLSFSAAPGIEIRGDGPMLLDYRGLSGCHHGASNSGSLFLWATNSMTAAQAIYVGSPYTEISQEDGVYMYSYAVRDIGIEGGLGCNRYNGGGASTGGVTWDHVSHIDMDRVFVAGWGGDGVYVDTTWLMDVRNSFVHDNGNDGFKFRHAQQNVMIDSTDISVNGSRGVEVYNDGVSSTGILPITLQNDIVQWNNQLSKSGGQGNGFWASWNTLATLTGNWFDDGGNNAVWPIPGNGGGYVSAIGNWGIDNAESAQQLCLSGSGSSTAYTCQMFPTWHGYASGQIFYWVPDVNGAGGATTLNIDGIGTTSVKKSDGATNPGSSDIVAGAMLPLWYDGTAFRFLGAVGGGGAVASVFGQTGAVPNLSGDVTTGGSSATTLAAVNGAPGTCGNATQVCQVTTNAKGLVTGQTPVTITGGTGSAFSGITSGTNNSGAMTCGTGCSLGTSGAGAITSTAIPTVSSAGSLPGTCTVGQLYFVSGATAGQQVYECSAANTWTQQVAGSGGGGGGAPAPVFNTYANLPACNSGATGTFFWASDISNKEWVCNGTAWQPVAFGMLVVEPTTLTWTGASGGSAPTITNVAGAVQLSGANSTGATLTMTMSAPIGLSTPYTIEVAFTFQVSSTASQWYNVGCGFGVAGSQAAASGGNPWEILYWYTAAPYGSLSLAVGYWTPNLNDRTQNAWIIASQPVTRAKIMDDGTNRTFYTNTGSGWEQIFQETDTTGVTAPPYWGVGCETYNVGDQFQLTLYHASVHH